MPSELHAPVQGIPCELDLVHYHLISLLGPREAMYQTFAWGPNTSGAVGCRGYGERHVYRVAKCPEYHFMRSLQWKPQPIRLQAISEELEQKLAAEEFVFSGPCVDCLQSEGDSPVRPKPETLSVHAGEREGRPRVADSLTTPIVQTATYTFRYMPLFVVQSRSMSYRSLCSDLLLPSTWTIKAPQANCCYLESLCTK